VRLDNIDGSTFRRVRENAVRRTAVCLITDGGLVLMLVLNKRRLWLASFGVDMYLDNQT
jgi:hypothetical protein